MEELTLDTNNNNQHLPLAKPMYNRNSSLDYSTSNCKAYQSDSPSSTPDSLGELFPSLPDVMLRKLCLLQENTINIESLSEQEIDSKFHTLSLAFKTDKFTLDQRVKLYRHQRDVAEADAKSELANLTEYVQELNRLMFSYDSKFFLKNNLLQLRDLKEMLDRLEWQCRVIQSMFMKISSRSELFGAVRQEEKLSTAFDVILLHLENLKRSKERDEKELEDMKRLLANNHSEQPNPIALLKQSSVGEASEALGTANINRRAFRSISTTMAKNSKIVSRYILLTKGHLACFNI